MVRVMVIPITQHMISTRTNIASPAISIAFSNSCATSALRLNTVDQTADTRVKIPRGKSEVRPGVSQSNAGTMANQPTSVSNRLAAGGKAGTTERADLAGAIFWSIPT